MAGSPKSDVSTLDGEGGAGPSTTVLENYVPVAVKGGPPVGVFEI